MMDKNQKVIIVPCSGIGKPYGTVSREAAYAVTEDLRSGQTQLVPLALLVLGDEQSRSVVAQYPAVTIDGCKLACAAKMVRQSGGSIAHEFAVLDVYRQHKDLKPLGIAELNEGGQKLARVLAGEVSALVDDLLNGKMGGENA
jgi:uncharacterized metal-binding protein